MTEAERTAAIEKVKTSIRTTTEDANLTEEIGRLIDAAIADMNIAGITGSKAVITDALYLTAVTLFVKKYFGAPEEFDRIRITYDEMKLQLRMNSEYTTW